MPYRTALSAHAELLRSVAARIVDRHVLRLIKLWLKVFEVSKAAVGHTFY